MSYRSIFLSFVMALLVSLIVGCGSSEEPPPTETVEAGEPEEGRAEDAESTTTPESAVVSSEVSSIGTLEDVRLGTIQVLAEGSFVDISDIAGGSQQTAGTGSGFIIDPSGIAVTNNHVVTGRSIIKVRIGGEGEWHRASVLGASECSDLAVIDIEGEGYPYLEWHNGDVAPPLKVYTAGFPLSDTEFTMTSGIVSKAQASGRTSWAYVDEVIEHDATINPGNSGGPLVSEAGQVVAVNYAGSSETGQYYAIAREEALEVIEQLREEQDVDAIGINGTAFSITLDNGQPFSGIFISSVKSGSSADQAGLAGGDIITEVEGISMGADGTMTAYCDILRGRSSPEATLSLEVLRTQTEPWSCWTGQINGRELESCSSEPNPTSEPIPTPERDETGSAAGIVTTAELNIHEGPGTAYPEAAQLAAGDDVVVLVRTQAADWVGVTTPDEKKGGWVDSESIKIIEGDIQAVTIIPDEDIPAPPTATPAPTKKPTGGGGGGLGSFRLWGANVFGSLAGGRDQWYFFDSGQDTEATIIAFMRNADQVDLLVYNGNDISWPPNPNDLPPHMGAGTEDGNRDGDSNTREFIWTGPISTNTRYYVRFVNRGGGTLRYCFVSRPDGVACNP